MPLPEAFLTLRSPSKNPSYIAYKLNSVSFVKYIYLWNDYQATNCFCKILIYGKWVRLASSYLFSINSLSRLFHTNAVLYGCNKGICMRINPFRSRGGMLLKQFTA